MKREQPAWLKANPPRHHRKGVLNGHAPGTRPIHHNRNPFDFARRGIRASKGFGDEARFHALLYMQDFRERIGDDPRQVALGAQACIAYAQVTGWTYVLLRAKPSTAKGIQAATQLMRWQERLEKCFRMVGFTKASDKRKQGNKRGGAFTPPRDRKRSEVGMGPDDQDADEPDAAEVSEAV